MPATRFIGIVLCLAVMPLVAVAEGYRLGNSVIPTYQEVDLVVDARSESYSGEVRIDVRIDEPVPTIRIHSEEIDIESATLWVDGKSVSLEALPGKHATVHLKGADEIPAGNHRLVIVFENEFNTQAVALYRLETDGHAYSFTQFEADEAREAFPCFDEPAFKLPYKLTLTVPKEHDAFSNTPVESETETEDGMRRVVFQKTKILPVYLIAIATGPFEEVEIPGLSVPGRILVRPGSEDLTAEAVRVTPPILEALESYFDWPHPFEKVDFVAVPEFWPGAMENVGLITYREGILVMDPARTTIGARRWQALVIAHELAHQWFGNVVTMEWWDDLWLNESFADWVAFKICVDLFPDYGFETNFVEDTQRAMAIDATRTTRTIRMPIESASSLLQSADALTYDKGKAMLRMFEQWMGAEKFRAGVNAYLRKHSWGNATADDLFASLSEQTDLDVGKAMATHLDQPGIPHVRVDQVGDGKVTLTQERFRNFSTELDASADSQLWTVPVTMRYADAEGVHTQRVVLSERRQTFDLKTDKDVEWFYPNAGETGYYRWSLPRERFVEMTRVAADALTPTERTGLLGTISALLDAGIIGGDDLLALIEQLSGDPDPDVEGSVLDLLGKVEDVFITPALEEDFARYVRRVVRPSLDHIGWEKRDGEADAVSSLRASLYGWLVDDGQDEEARRRMLEVADRFHEDPESVDPVLVRVALRTSAMLGDRALFERYKQGFESAKTPTDRRRFLSVLGEFRDPEIIEEALAYALAGPMRPQEINTIPRDVAGHSHAWQEHVFTWMTKNVETIMGRIPPPFQVYLPYYGLACSQELLTRTNEFFGREGIFPDGTQTELAKVNEYAGECLDLRSREGAEVAAYLRGRGATGAGGSAAGAPGG